MERRRLLDSVATTLGGLRPGHPVRVAVDGPDAAGKTTFADDLAAALGTGRPVLRLGIDDFHQPPQVRSRRGGLSAEGYYLDAFDLDAIRDGVLRPLGPGGDRRYLLSTFDHRAGRPTARATAEAPPDAVMIVDGVLLLRPELRDHWEFSVYLHVEPEETLRRALVRDRDLFGGERQVVERYTRRYLPAQALYRERDRPLERAVLVVDHTDPAEPRIVTDRR
ncbi:nucleoside/nucleotide kinase family protein [Jiangella endophytica]|uniref:uridine kinase n=1 Tax=Jiangella endophytica TaxID=1623398 RepID=UPI0013004080|nr:uridine kinase [Jiangella endophytica]